MILRGDARHLPLRDKSVQCVVTSPPYWNLRDYGVRGQIGMEGSVEEYIETIRAVFAELWCVCRDDAVVWLNLGDSYAGSGHGLYKNGLSRGTEGPKQQTNGGSIGVKAADVPRGLKPKDLIGIPWRIAFALQADGWYLRSDIIWAKPNPMPESVQDRPTRSHEYLFLLSKSAKYFYDQDAIKEPGSMASLARLNQPSFLSQNGGPKDYGDGSNRSTRRALENLKLRVDKQRGHGRRHDGFNDRWDLMGKEEQCSFMVNKRDVWTINSEPTPEAHFATFPQALVTPCILAGTSAKGECVKCGANWVREVERVKGESNRVAIGKALSSPRHDGSTWNENNGRGFCPVSASTTSWRPGCACNAQTRPNLVLDPFLGSGTVGIVAERLGRRWIGTDLSADYIEISKRRTRQMGLFATSPSAAFPTAPAIRR